MPSSISAGDLDKRQAGEDSVTAFDPQFTTISRSASVPIVVGGTVMVLGPGDVGYFQNLHAAQLLLIKLGSGASATSYEYTLPFFNGQVLRISDYIGPISVFNATAYSYVAWKQS